jgi:hypothetical protein
MILVDFAFPENRVHLECHEGGGNGQVTDRTLR